MPDLLLEAAMITAFVATMMIAVEYLNVLTRGTFERVLRGSPWAQYVGAVVLGAIPGCLGAFTVVALYSHRVVTLGAVTGAMIATSGDEAFVLFALVPRTALALTLGLLLLGLAVAPVVDRFAPAESADEGACDQLAVHPEECVCFPRGEILGQWRPPTPARALLFAVLAAWAGWIAAGGPGVPPTWGWLRVTILAVSLFGAFVVGTVPDHFLREHLLEHVALRHVPRIFAWTAGVLVAVAFLDQVVAVEALVRENVWAVLGAAALLGLIPESGPHLVFVTLYAHGTAPLAVLLASSVVQDGHGMLPLLAESRRDFFRVKAVNLAVGLAVGAALLLLG